MRIIGGIHRGRPLLAPKDDSIRPTADKVRGAIFNVLLHNSFPMPPLNAGTRVADLFCGTGALGLEALSRGAAQAAFIDKNPVHLALARDNAAKLRIGNACNFLLRDATAVPAAAAPYDLLFIDPPYRQGLVNRTLPRLVASGWLHSGSVLVVETGADEPEGFGAGFINHTRRVYGDTAVSFLTPVL
jgi:16S rRNA (guanine966-N2)-methyltransferase